ncbi:MAG TPA: 3-oxoacyl-[acyl-carrier-protein] synthase III C-terminal domain-containing protein [Bacillota bacterium]|nr:3-oxoacyl-[acyl-carrier-protein] synthase III C-terminal domain-containing protein [Bacillota bacterium]
MPYIVGAGVAKLPYTIKQTDIKPFIKEMFSDVFADLERLLTVFENTDIDQRNFCVPMEWFREPHNFKEKNHLYIQQAVKLGKEALTNCLANANLTINDITHLFFISTSGLSTPSIDARIMNELMDSPLVQVKRTPIWGLGCAGGAGGIARAMDYCLAYPKEIVAVISVELCGLTFQPNDLSKSNLVATSLFADGAAAVLVAGDQAKASGSLKMVHSQSILWNNTLDVMGWDISSSGFHVIFSKDIPTFVQNQVAQTLQKFLQEHDRSSPDHFILHPGGKKVLEAYQKALNIPIDKLNLARKVLRENGNMSSSTVLYVLNEFLQNEVANKGEIGLITALGPGFSSEMLLVEGV